MDKQNYRITMKKPNKFLFLLSISFTMIAVVAQKDIGTEKVLRGYSNQRYLQENDCIIPGGVGWYFCSNNNCLEGYECIPEGWVGFSCHKIDCSVVTDREFDDDDDKIIENDDGDDDEDGNDNVDDIDSCWIKPCSFDSDCNEGSKCFAKNDDTCACRDSSYSPECVKYPEDGDWKDIVCTPPLKHSQSPSHSPSENPSQDPSETLSQSPTSLPTLSPVNNDKSKDAKKSKSKKFKRLLGHMDIIYSRVPSQGVRGAK